MKDKLEEVKKGLSESLGQLVGKRIETTDAIKKEELNPYCTCEESK